MSDTFGRGALLPCPSTPTRHLKGDASTLVFGFFVRALHQHTELLRM